MEQHNHLDDQKGFVLVASMLFLVLLTVIGIAALNRTSMELLITGNDKEYKTDFYNQEMTLAIGKLNYRDWLTTAYLTADQDEAFFPDGEADDDGDGIADLSEIVDDYGATIGSYRVRNNVSAAAFKDIDWEDKAVFNDDSSEHPANKIPLLDHIDKPIPGTGYDPKNFEIRRFTITAYTPGNERKVILQEGVYKVFNKYE